MDQFCWRSRHQVMTRMKISSLLQNQSRHKKDVLASDLITLDDFNLDSDSPEAEFIFGLKKRATHSSTEGCCQHSQGSVCVCVCVCVCTWEWYIIVILMILQENTVGWDHAVQAQLDNLKQWLELQFIAFNRKIDAIVEKQRRHRKVCHIIKLLILVFHIMCTEYHYRYTTMLHPQVRGKRRKIV